MTTTQLAGHLADLDADRRAGGWYRTDRGNYTRAWCGHRLTVYPVGGGFGWSVRTGELLRFSHDVFPTEADAVAAVLAEVNDR